MSNLVLLGKTAKAHLDKAEKYKDKYDQHSVAAGKTLLDAKAGCQEEGVSFVSFCREHGIGRSRAYEVMAIAGGDEGISPKTEEQVRRAERSRPSRQKPRRDLSGATGQPTNTTQDEPEETDEDPDEVPEVLREVREYDELVVRLCNYIKRLDLRALQALERKLLK